ncbi:Putative Catalytic activity: [Aspergillus calidoustus]|uniref:Putative Catalytic activity n=1 Tax=Aspergillus calidoustus TaxID=454130 RepID=A0A0U5GED5_ASPCI|nr:Putative Catalytic activity: [Aspergillus calidoustus]
MPSLKSYKLLTFDVYGTLVDWEGGIIAALQPALSKSPSKKFTKHELLHAYHALEKSQQEKTPDMLYSDVLSTIHAPLLEKLGLHPPSAEESRAFGESIGSWPAFGDTVAAFYELKKHYKLVVLSNVDRQSFAKTNAGSLQGFPFDLIITAQDVGSYKPDVRNFEYMLAAVEREFGVKREEVLQTAQSQFHDHHPAKKVGIASVWIERPGAVMGNLEENIYDWRFETLGDMAEALKREG